MMMMVTMMIDGHGIIILGSRDCHTAIPKLSYWVQEMFRNVYTVTREEIIETVDSNDTVHSCNKMCTP